MCTCVFFSVFRSVILYEIVFFFVLSRCFILGDVSIIHSYADLKKSVILFFGSYRVINVHKGVRTMLHIFLSLSFRFTLLLSVGFYFGVTSYFFSLF